MAASGVDSGFGASITFATGYCAKIISISLDGMTREPIDTTNMASTNGWADFIPSDIKTMGSMTVELLHDKNAAGKTNLAAAAGSIVVTYPISSGGSTAGTITCNGFLTEIGVEIPMDDVMTQTCKFQFTSEPTFVDQA